MRIGALARQTGVPTKTIRYYESLGVLPEPQRESNGYRSYTGSAANRLTFIKDAQAAGLNLTEIQWILDLRDSGEDTCHHVADLLDQRIEALDHQMEELQRTRSRLEELASFAHTADPSICTDPDRCQTIPQRKDHQDD